MRLVISMLFCLLLIGCNRSTPTNQNDGGGVKVRAPGVNVDIQKTDAGKAKVDVDVQK